MIIVDELLRKALATVLADLDKPELAIVTPETNVFDNIDSFSVVDLMLETEMLLESETGSYITLADETIFDSEKSPLLKWSTWIGYVKARCDDGK